MRPLKYLFGIVCIVYFPLVFIVAALMPNEGGFMPLSYWLNLLAVILVSLPTYISFVTVGLTVDRVFFAKERGKRSIVFAAIGLTLAVLPLVAFVHLSKLIPIALWSAVFQIAVLIIEFFVSKRKLRIPNIFKDSSFWIACVLSLVALSLCTFGLKNIIDASYHNKEEYLSTESVKNLTLNNLQKQYCNIHFFVI